MADLHLISYEVERDLIPLILSNCQYSMEKGGETLQDFDLERIQQQIISKFLQGKPLVTLTVGEGSWLGFLLLGWCWSPAMFAAARPAPQQGEQRPHSFTALGSSRDREYPPSCTGRIGTTSSSSAMSGVSWIRWVCALEEAGQACDPLPPQEMFGLASITCLVPLSTNLSACLEPAQSGLVQSGRG